MRHIESNSGDSYPICSMDSNHLENTINLLLKRAKAINATVDHNPRYINDIEDSIERIALYYFDAKMREQLNPLIEQEIEKVYYDYKRNRAKIQI